jgi:hypothetical protein
VWMTRPGSLRGRIVGMKHLRSIASTLVNAVTRKVLGLMSGNGTN